ncbi:MAG: toast rack family protein [Anaerolineales bacterium]|jgi:hypothetical protein
MNRYKKIATMALTLALVTLACGINLQLPDDAIDIGPLVTDNINIPVPKPGETTEVKLNFGAGEMAIHLGSPGSLITGTATYNVESLSPEVTTSGNKITIDQETFDYEFTGLPNFGDLENIWDLYFSSDPVELDIRAGAFKGEFEFGGMAIEDLKFFGGASDVNMSFSTPNLAPMSSFRITTGASDLELTGLANANFSLMDFKAGAGDYLLDFSGNLVRDATVDVNAAISNLSIIVPAGVNAQVHVEGALTNVTARGVWVGEGEFFEMGGEGSSLTINVDIEAGTVTLEN